jgi:hypothetical protein
MVNLPKTISRDQVSGLLTVGEFSALIIGVLAAAGVYLLMKANRRVRILLTVVVFLELLSQLVFGLIAAGTLLGVVGLLLLYLPRSNAYFAELKRQAV